MNDDDRRVLEILREALDTTPEERITFISLRCGNDTSLRDRVQAMLARIAVSERDETGDVDAIAGQHRPTQADTDEVQDSLIGSVLGPFRIVERMGRGGMGVVYRGLRDATDFVQEVAIKRIRQGFDFDDIRARFIRERRILARLSHPNLARFIDGGIDEDGRPWFAMEFVRGEPISRWADVQRLGIHDRVELFLEVCAAVQYAHTQLIVHRDLKPGNVLVDADRQVRLLDFGVAGLLASDIGDPAQPTTLGVAQAFTPEYAAPEQYSGEAVGVSADVYALGVMLYELVSGVLPYPIDRHDLAEARRTVLEMPPQALGQAISRVATKPTAGAVAPSTQAVTAARLAARSETLRSYRHQVRGDLARILETALAKEPARRYATAQALTDDLERWLAGIPVQVGGNGAGYRLRKFVGRHRIAVGVAGLCIAFIVAGVAGTLWQARKAASAAIEAKAQATRALAARDFLASLLGDASPEQSRGQDTTVREVLEKAHHRIGSDLASQPELRIELSTLVAGVYNDLASYEQAIPLLEAAVHDADSDAAIAPAIRAHAHAEYAYVLLSRDAGKLAEGEARIAVDLLRAQTPDDALISALGTLATAYYLQRRFDEALLAQSEAVELAARINGRDSESHASTKLELNYFLLGAGKAAKAIDAAEQALAILDRLYPDGCQPIVTRALWAVGNALSSADRDAEALPYLRRARDLVGVIYGVDGLKYMRSLQLLGTSELETGAVQAARDDFAEAERLLRTQAPEHPLRDLVLGYYGESLLRNGESARAADVLGLATEHARTTNKTDIRQRSTILLARARLAEGRSDDAIRLLVDCIAELRGAGSKRLPVALVAYAAALRQQGRLVDAAAQLAEARPLLESTSRTSRIEGALESARLAAASGDTQLQQTEALNARDLLLAAGAGAAPEFVEAQRLSGN